MNDFFKFQFAKYKFSNVKLKNAKNFWRKRKINTQIFMSIYT